MKKITVIGGGTGTFVVLSGLKQYALDLGVIVNMMDSGGSTGKLRDQLGVLPPGDLRQCLVALSEASLLWRKLFLYRFEKGDLKGHNFGNIFISALEKVSSDYNEVLENASYVLKTKGKVIPVTFEKSNLCVTYANGEILKGEGNIDENILKQTHIIKAFLEPTPKANHKAVERIIKSDIIIIGPGDVYTTIIPILLIPEIRKALQKTKARIVYIMNLMTKSGQTTNYTAQDHVRDIEKYLGRKPNYIIVNNGKVPKDILQWYMSKGEKVVVNNVNTNVYTVIEDDLVSRTSYLKSTSDSLTRSILRHDGVKLANVINAFIT